MEATALRSLAHRHIIIYTNGQAVMRTMRSVELPSDRGQDPDNLSPPLSREVEGDQ